MAVIPAPEQAKSAAIPKATTAPKSVPTVSVSERLKAYNSTATANDKPKTVAAVSGSTSVADRTRAFNQANDAITKKDEPKQKEAPKKSGGLFGGSKGKSKAKAAPAKKSAPAKTAKPTEPKMKKGGFFGGKGKDKDETPKPKPPPAPAKQSSLETKKKKGGFFGKKDKAADAPAKKSDDKENAAAPVVSSKKPGKLSMAALSINIPGLGGGGRGTDTSTKNAPGKPPPQIDIFAEQEQDPDQQGHAGMSDKARQTLVGPKIHGKDDWKFLYELATQYDAYKLQQAEACKNPSKAKTPSKAAPSPGDTEAIKNNLNNVFGGGPGGGASYTADGSFLNNKYFDKYLVEHSSGVALEFANETSLYKRFCRKDQEQRTISEKFVKALLKHPKSKKITQLNMPGALLPDAFLVALCNQCASGSALPLLQVLNLESNDLGREGIEALSKCIASPKAMKRLQILKLENQKKEISAGAEEVLGEAIVQSVSLVQVGLRIKGGVPKQQVANTIQANLDKLRVARREHASKKGKLKARKRNEMETLFDTIAANKDKRLTEVDLTENLRFLGLDETERTKTGAAFATNKYVTKVTMTKLKLDDDFAEAFGKALAKNKTLETVILDSNSFSAKGVKALLNGLGQNKSVTNFQIRHQSKTMASADEEALPALLKKNTTLVNLGTDVRNPLIQSQLDRKTNENRELQRKQRNAQKKK